MLGSALFAFLFFLYHLCRSQQSPQHKQLPTHIPDYFSTDEYKIIRTTCAPRDFRKEVILGRDDIIERAAIALYRIAHGRAARRDRPAGLCPG